MKMHIPKWKVVAGVSGVAFLSLAMAATAQPTVELAGMPLGQAGQITMNCTHEHPPLGPDRKAAEWHGSLIFKNENRTPRVEISDAEFEAWVDTASQPFVETGQVVTTWAPGRVSYRTIFQNSVLCPVGRDHYFATDGERLVEQMSEGDFNHFAVRGPQPGEPNVNDALWSSPHAAAVLQPLAWFEESDLGIQESTAKNGGSKLVGASQVQDARVPAACVQKAPGNDNAVTEVRYLYRRPQGGTLLVEGIMSDHRDVGNGVLYPHHIVWTVQLVRRDMKTPDVTKVIEFDPYTHLRWTLDVVSAECADEQSLFPAGFLPEAPADTSYMDFRFPKGSEARVDPLFQDYREF